MLHEAGERKLEVDKNLKEINERMDRLVAEASSATSPEAKENLMTQLSDLESKLYELREGQMKQVKIGVALSKTISDMVAEMSEDLKSESLL